MENTLIPTDIKKYYAKMVKKNTIGGFEIKDTFYDSYIKPNILIISMLIITIIFFMFGLKYLPKDNIKKDKKNKKKKYLEDDDVVVKQYGGDAETVFSEKDRNDLIKIIDELTLENYKQSITNVPTKTGNIKSYVGETNFMNLNSHNKYDTEIDGVYIESPFASQLK